MKILWPGRPSKSELRALVGAFGTDIRIIPYSLEPEMSSDLHPYGFIDFVTTHRAALAFTKSAIQTAAASALRLQHGVFENLSNGEVRIVRMFHPMDDFRLQQLWPRDPHSVDLPLQPTVH